MNDPPLSPDLTDRDIKIYLPVTSIWRVIVTVWREITGTNYSIKRRKVK